MKYLIIIFVCLISAACHSYKTSSEPVVLKDAGEIRVLTKTVTEIDTVTVYVEIPAQTVEHVTLDSTSHVETDIAESDAWLNADGSLGHNICNKPQKLGQEAYVPKTTVNSEREEETVKEVPVIVPEPYPVEQELSAWQSVQIGSFWPLLAIVLASAVWIFRKPIKFAIGKILR